MATSGAIYDPEYADQAKRLASVCALTNKGFARFFGVTAGDIKRWREQHADFNDACMLRETQAIPAIVDSALQCALDGQPWAIQFVLSRRAGWEAKTSMDVSVKKSTTEMTDDELLRIAEAGKRVEAAATVASEALARAATASDF